MSRTLYFYHILTEAHAVGSWGLFELHGKRFWLACLKRGIVVRETVCVVTFLSGDLHAGNIFILRSVQSILSS